MKLRRKMTLISVTTTSCLAILIVIFFYYFAHREIKNRTIDTFQMQSHLISRELERFFFERIGDIELLSGRIKILKGVKKISLIEPFLIQTKETYRIYDNLYFISPNGAIIASTQKNVTKRFSNPLVELSKKSPVTLFSLSSSAKVIFFVKAIKKTNGEIIGFLIAEVPISYVTEKIRQVSLTGKYNYLEEIELRRTDGQVLFSQNTKKDHFVDLSRKGFQEDNEYM